MRDIEIQCFSKWSIEPSDKSEDLVVSPTEDGGYKLKIPGWANFSVPQLYNEGDMVKLNGSTGIISCVYGNSYAVTFDNGNTEHAFTSELEKMEE